MRRPFFYALGVTLAIGALALADPPKAAIVAEATYPPGVPVVLDGRSSVSEPGLSLRWAIAPAVPIVGMRPDDDTRPGTLAFLPKVPPGQYRVKLIVRGKPDPAKADLDADADVFDFTVGPAPVPAPTPDPAPPPTPAPTPQPPAPVPLAGTFHVSLVLDLGGMTPALATLREGLTIRAAESTLNLHYRTYSSASPDLARLNLAPIVAKVGAPCLIVQDHQGHVLAAETAPPTEAAILARVTAIREGGK